ncbi:MAG: hypothetical protein K2I91_01600, partial [Muribaculaceae bacterium]|nr:hypothetical protein [Muribaculaceae bacterium]
MKKRDKILFDGQYTLPFEELQLPPVITKNAADCIHSRTSETLRPQNVNDNPANIHILYISFGTRSSGNRCYNGNKKAGIIVEPGV